MANGRVSMNKVKEILRLRHECRLSVRKVALSIKTSHSTVLEYLRKAVENGIGWPVGEGWSEEKLREIFFPVEGESKSQRKNLPDFEYVMKEMRKKGVTLQLLWEEYRQVNPEGYSYSHYCALYEAHQKSRDYVLRQDYRGGEKLFVDYAGQTVEVHNPHTGEIRKAQIFVACLGASNYTYAEATWSQGSRDWISSHIRTFEYIGGVPEVIIPDNLKSGVTRACRYDPDIHASYREMSEHYGTAILPARVRKPRDKAKVEVGVLIVERWILAALRHRKFHSLGELNEAIAELLKKLNHRPFKKLSGCRFDLFQEVDKPSLKALPEKRYEYAEWKFNTTVHIDYHVEIEKYYYSVPCGLIGKKVDVRYTFHTVEIFHRGERKAVHVRNYHKNKYSTQDEHRPKSHQEYLKWNPERFLNWSSKIGENCQEVIRHILNQKQYPEQGYRQCLGILRLEKSYSRDRLEKACKRAVYFRIFNYRNVTNILKNGKDQEMIQIVRPPKSCTHENIRGQIYYETEEKVSCC